MYSFSFDLSIFIKEDKWTSTQPWLEVVHVQVFHLFVLWDGVNITQWRQKCFIVLTFCIVFELFLCMFVRMYYKHIWGMSRGYIHCIENDDSVWIVSTYRSVSTNATLYMCIVYVFTCVQTYTPYNGSLFWHNFGLLPIGVDMMLYEILIVFVYEHRRYATPHISQYPCMYIHVYVCNKNTSYNNNNMR